MNRASIHKIIIIEICDFNYKKKYKLYHKITCNIGQLIF